MSKPKTNFKRIIMGMPLATIIGASLLPLQTWGQQALVLFVLLWFNIFILLDVIGK